MNDIRNGLLNEYYLYLIAVAFASATLIITSPVAWNYYDLHLYMLTWNDALNEGWNVYAHSNSQYPPLGTYLFIFSEMIARRTADNPMVKYTLLEPINWVRIVTRIPLMIGYFATGHLIYTRWGWSTVRYWLLTPPVFITVILTQYHIAFTPLSVLSWTGLVPLRVFWGYQFELVALPFALLACYSLLDHKPYRFAIYASIGAMLKLFPVLLLPLALARFDVRETTKAAIVSISIAVAVMLPFLLTSPENFYHQLFGFQGERYPQGLSLSHLPLLLVHYQIDQFHQFDYLKWTWQLIWFPLYGYLVYLGWRTDDDDSLILISGAVLLSFVLCNKIGNLNYLVWFWPFLLFALDRGYVTWRYPTVIIVTASAYVFTIQFAAAIIEKPYLVVQDLEWYDARAMVEGSFKGVAQESLISNMELLRSEFGWLFHVIYENQYVIVPAIIVIHNIALAMILLRLVQASRIYNYKIELSMSPIQKTSGKPQYQAKSDD